METKLYLPYINVDLELGVFYYVICFFLICGMVNAVNLTDGLDGLASVCTLGVGAFLTVVGLSLEESIAASFFGALLIGISVAFLVFNLHPAKIFMGDTGSLFFGGVVVGAGFVLNNPLLVLVYGFVFLLEAVSVILQVSYFKITKGKRLFKMAPLHHHLEKCGMSEMKIVAFFGLANLLFCFIACFGVR